jgi:hypothetical protein
MHRRQHEFRKPAELVTSEAAPPHVLLGPVVWQPRKPARTYGMCTAYKGEPVTSVTSGRNPHFLITPSRQSRRSPYREHRSQRDRRSSKVNISEGLILRAMQAQLAALALDMTAIQERLATLEAGKGECPTCVQRRAADAMRQRRSRLRHVTEAAEMPP